VREAHAVRVMERIARRKQNKSTENLFFGAFVLRSGSPKGILLRKIQ